MVQYISGLFLAMKVILSSLRKFISRDCPLVWFVRYANMDLTSLMCLENSQGRKSKNVNLLNVFNGSSLCVRPTLNLAASRTRVLMGNGTIANQEAHQAVAGHK